MAHLRILVEGTFADNSKYDPGSTGVLREPGRMLWQNEWCRAAHNLVLLDFSLEFLYNRLFQLTEPSVFGRNL